MCMCRPQCHDFMADVGIGVISVRESLQEIAANHRAHQIPASSGSSSPLRQGQN